MNGIAEPAARLIERLLAVDSDLGRQLRSAAPIPLRGYLRSLFDVPAATPSPSLHKFAAAVEQTLRSRDHPNVDAVCEEYLTRPVVQQSDHANLLLDPETFLNNLLFHSAAAEAGRPFAITSQCTTVVCFSRRVPPTGPVFLTTRGARYDVFGRSKTAYKNANFCALTGPVRLQFVPLEGAFDDGDAVLGPLRGARFESAPQAYTEANERIWTTLGIDDGVTRVQIDEATTSLAIAAHVEDPGSPVHRLLFDPQLRAAFLQIKRELVESAHNIAINRAEPDWLWLRRGERLHEVVFDPEQPASPARVLADGQPLPFEWQPSVLAGLLRGGQVFGDRVLAYLVRCLLPGAVAVGGTVQQDYVDTYRRMVVETHRRVPFLDVDELAAVERPDASRLGGAPLIELDETGWEFVQALGPGSDPAGWLARFLDETVGATVGALKCAWFYEDLLARTEQRRARGRGPAESEAR